MARNSFWNEPIHQEILEELAAQKLTAEGILAKLQPIAEKQGFTLTRNAIIGRCWRTYVVLNHPDKIMSCRVQNGKDLVRWRQNPKNHKLWCLRIKEGVKAAKENKAWD